MSGKSRTPLIVASRTLEKILSQAYRVENLELLSGQSRTVVYVGRGPNGRGCHLAHYTVWKFAADIAKCLRAQMHFMISDDEKEKGITHEGVVSQISRLLHFLGRRTEDTVLFRNTRNKSVLYTVASHTLSKHARIGSVMSLLGVGKGQSVFNLVYTLVQSAPVLINNERGIHTVIVSGLDQKPHLDFCQQLMRSLGKNPPTVVYTRTIPPLTGHHQKMTASRPKGVLYLNDSPEDVSRVIKSAVSGAPKTLSELRTCGVDESQDRPLRIAESLGLLVEESRLYRRGVIGSLEFKSALTREVNTLFGRIKQHVGVVSQGLLPR